MASRQVICRPQRLLHCSRVPLEELTAKWDYFFTVLILGDHGVGKSSLLLRFCNKDYNPFFLETTVGLDFKIKTITVKGKRVKLKIWDTAGQDRFHTLTKFFYRGAHGVMMVYDSTRLRTLKNLSKWTEEVKRYAVDGLDGVAKIMIANKSDMEMKREVPAAVGSQVASDYGMKFLETSATSAKNVDLAFQQLAESMILQHLTNKRGEGDPNVIPGDSLCPGGQVISQCCAKM